MQRQLRFTDEADRQLRELETNPAKKSLLKQAQKTLGFLEINVRSIMKGSGCTFTLAPSC